MKQRIVNVSVIIGVLIFALLIAKIGPAQIWSQIKKVSLENFLILVGLRILYWVLRTLNWKVILEAYEGKTSLFHLFTARMCGHAVSQLTPTAQVGSEATRIFMADCSSKKISIASVVVDKTIEFLTVIFFIIIGIAALFTRIALPGKMKIIFIGGVALFSLAVMFIFFKQKKGLLGWIVDLLARLKIRLKFLEKHREKIRETDEQISRFYRDHQGAFLKVFLLYSLLMLLWTTEIHVNLLFIGVKDISFGDSFIVTALGNLAFVFPFIPGSLGLYEATYIGLFVLLGRPARVGFTLVLIRRLIALLMAGLGLLGMLKPNALKKRK
jgi:glycosyltransferase 2 family protein